MIFDQLRNCRRVNWRVAVTGLAFRPFVFFTALVSVLVGTCPASAASEQTAKEFVLCKSHHEVRTIRILPEDKQNCTITYSKGGSEEVVGAKRTLKTCQSILHSIQNNLEAAKWNCRNVQTARLSETGEASAQ